MLGEGSNLKWITVGGLFLGKRTKQEQSLREENKGRGRRLVPRLLILACVLSSVPQKPRVNGGLVRGNSPEPMCIEPQAQAQGGLQMGWVGFRDSWGPHLYSFVLCFSQVGVEQLLPIISFPVSLASLGHQMMVSLSNFHSF